MKHVGDAIKTTVLLKKGRQGVGGPEVQPGPPQCWREAGRKPELCLCLRRAVQSGGSGGERCLFEQPEMLRGPWCLSISQFLLSRGELKAAEVMSHRSCAVLSPLKSSFQLVIFLRPHNNPGNC